MSHKPIVYFILPTLYAGGAERVISFVSQNINKEKFCVKLIVIGFEKDSKYTIDNVPVIYLNKNRVLNAVIPICKILIIDKPNIVMSSIAHLNSLMGLISQIFPKIKFIGRLSSISKISAQYHSEKRKFNIPLKFNIYDYGIKKLDFIICQSLDMKNDLLESFNYDDKKIRIIHNPVTQTEIIKHSSKNSNSIKQYITIGRLDKIKGHLRLLDILNKIDWDFKYTIIGDGPLKSAIFEKIEKLGFESKVDYVQHTDNVFDYLINHDLFLQGSYSEGFPNALLESCAVGTPVLSFNVLGGTKEILEDGINGFLVKDEAEFIEKLKDNREWNPEKIRESVYRKFSREKIISDYEQLFLDVLK